MSVYRKLFILSLVMLGLFLGFRYALPLLLPFLLGWGIARAAEPLVTLGTNRLKLPRGLSCAFGVTFTLVGLLTLVTLLLTLTIRELGVLAGILPDMEQTAREGITLLENSMLDLAMSAPKGVRSLLTRSVMSLFGGGEPFTDTVSRHLPGIASALLSRIPGSALTLGTAVISAFMISARLPKLKTWTQAQLPRLLGEKLLPMLKHLRQVVFKWLTAQAKLSGVSFFVVCLGLVVLKVPYAPIWALLIALVDALPLLGTGAVLLPWALIALLRQDIPLAIGLTATYGAAFVLRTVLEPRVLGQQLGLDPLLTLVALYIGFQLWGFWGMVAAPLLAVVTAELVKTQA